MGLDPFATSATAVADALAAELLPSSVCDTPASIVDILTQYAHDASIQRRGYYALTQLAALGTDQSQAVIDGGTLAVVFSGMARHEAVAGVQVGDAGLRDSVIV